MKGRIDGFSYDSTKLNLIQFYERTEFPKLVKIFNTRQMEGKSLF